MEPTPQPPPDLPPSPPDLPSSPSDLPSSPPSFQRATRLQKFYLGIGVLFLILSAGYLLFYEFILFLSLEWGHPSLRQWASQELVRSRWSYGYMRSWNLHSEIPSLIKVISNPEELYDIRIRLAFSLMEGCLLDSNFPHLLSSDLEAYLLRIESIVPTLQEAYRLGQEPRKWKASISLSYFGLDGKEVLPALWNAFEEKSVPKQAQKVTLMALIRLAHHLDSKDLKRLAPHLVPYREELETLKKEVERLEEKGLKAEKAWVKEVLQYIH
jgi:hypothetical protein